MILLDTSFLVAVANDRDKHHEAALDVLERLRANEWEHVLLSEHVFAETVPVLKRKRGHETATRFGEVLLRSEEITCLPASDPFVAVFARFADDIVSGRGFVDTALVHLANEHHVTYIASFDRDFDGVPGLYRVPGA